MSRRLLALTGVAVVIVAIMAVIALPKLRPGGGSNASATAWGEPDLQGIWTSDGETPAGRLTRAAALAAASRMSAARTTRRSSPRTSAWDAARR